MKCFEQDVAIKKEILDKLKKISYMESKLESAILSVDDIIDNNKNLQDWQWESKGMIRELKKANLILREQLRKLEDGELYDEMF